MKNKKNEETAATRLRKNIATFKTPLVLAAMMLVVIIMMVWWQILFSHIVNNKIKTDTENLEIKLHLAVVDPEFRQKMFNSGTLHTSESCLSSPCRFLEKEGLWLQIAPSVQNEVYEYGRSKINLIYWETSFLMLVLFFAMAYLLSVIVRDRRLHDEQDEFIAMATHELKQPLSSISLTLQSLQRGTIPDEKRGVYLQKSVEGINTLRAQIDDLMRVQELQMMSSKSKSYDLASYIKILTTELKQANPETASRLVFENKQEEPVITRLNKSALQTIMKNLIDNGLKYSKDRVVVQITEVNRSPCIRIIDTGMGFSSDEKDRVGRMFYRSHRYEIQNISGTGLGLFTVYRIARIVGLQIEISSAGENQGSEARVLIK